jgi:hemolysin III
MLRDRFQHLSVEEFANTVTHGFGLLLSIVGFVALVVMAMIYGGPLLITSFLVYGISLIVLYAASTIYHGTSSPELKRKLQIADHCCIYLLIAGTYTPFGLIIFDGALGRNLLILIWAFAAVGIISKIFLGNRFMVLSVISYLIMGWIGAAAIQPLFSALGWVPTLLAITGGLAYSFGVIFFAWRRLPHNHAIFHVFVLIGSVLHFFTVILYVRPLS